MRFKLNDKDVELPEYQRDDRLLWVLRDHFKLLGPKFGCGIGVCGACTIHVNGEARRSCSLTLADVANQTVTTLEALSPSKSDMHPVQIAWKQEQVPQCGYCQNGQIMTAAAELKGNPDITEAELDAVMNTVRCRCGTQLRIKAALRLAQSLVKRDRA